MSRLVNTKHSILSHAISIKQIETPALCSAARQQHQCSTTSIDLKFQKQRNQKLISQHSRDNNFFQNWLQKMISACIILTYLGARAFRVLMALGLVMEPKNNVNFYFSHRNEQYPSVNNICYESLK